MSAYTKKTYVNDTTPALSATNLNSTEQGIYDIHAELTAYYANTVGVVSYFAGSTPPTGWIKCNGAGLDTTAYAALYAVIGYTFGGSGATFNIPDLRGLFIRGWDHGVGRDSGRAFGSYQADTIGYHRHSFTDELYVGNQLLPNATLAQPYNASTTTDTTTTVPASGEGRPKNVAMIACIKY
jgi:microcystin-dependent protein